MYAYAVIPEKLVKAQGAKTFFHHPIGSGPFMVTSRNKGSELDFTVNPYWYGTKPNIKNVKIMIVPNDNSRVLLLQNKNADMIENPPGNLIDQIERRIRICRRISSRRRGSTSSSSTSTSRRSRIRTCARR